MITDLQLYRWVIRQREMYKKGNLSKRQIDMLEAIPGWTWNTFDAAWEKGFENLKKYGMVVLSFETPDGFKLGGWISRQRSICKDPERRKRLESIPGWSWNPWKSWWEEGFSYLKKHGNGLVVNDFKTTDGYPLGGWVCTQRAFCRDPERRKRLESIPGWVWNAVDAAWEEGFNNLKKYRVMSTRFITPDGYNLGRWTNKQRHTCKDPERRKRLESIPGWSWNMKAAEWEVGFKNLKKYKIVSRGFVTPDGYHLGRWVGKQRIICKDPERRKRLESIPGWKWRLRISKKAKK